jgi:hypothetical protein
VSDDQSALTYRQAVTDPATFTEPAVRESQHLALGERIEPCLRRMSSRAERAEISVLPIPNPRGLVRRLRIA